MPTMDLKLKIKQLVENNKLQQAIDEFKDFAERTKDTDLEHSLILINSRLERVERQSAIGILTFTESLRETSVIASSILDLLARTDFSVEVDKPVREEWPVKKENGSQPSKEDKKKTIIFLASMPLGMAKLQLEKEFMQLSLAVQREGFPYELVAQKDLTAHEMHRGILIHSPNIVHFSGHGTGGSEDQESGIFLEDENKRPMLMPTEILDETFQIFQEEGIFIDVVVLNACSTKGQAEAIGKHVPYVIGMTSAMKDSVATEFSMSFYQTLALKKGIPLAFKLARTAVRLHSVSGDAMPVLYENAELIQARNL